MLQMIGQEVVIREQDSCERRYEKTIYNPYTKQYQPRRPTKRKEHQEEIKYVLQQQEKLTDVIWIGDRMQEGRVPGTIRIWLQNYNGIEKYDTNMMKYQLAQMADNQISYFSFTETRFNSYNREARKKWEVAREAILPNGMIKITNSPNFPNKVVNQPGGVMSGFSGALFSRYASSGADKYGRWHYHQFYGKERALRIYTLYRVNNANKEQQGDTTAWTQQHLLLTQDKDYRNPRKAVMEDFLQEISSATVNKLSVIILSDLNEHVNGLEKSNKKLEAIGLTNIMEQYVGQEGLPRTFNRGISAIDHIWVTNNIVEHIHAAGYAPFNFLHQSDHRGLYIDIYYKQILDENMHCLQPPSRQRLKSTIPNRVVKYIDIIEQQWEYHNMADRFLKLYANFEKDGATTENVRTLNVYDMQITEIMKHAEKKCCNLPLSGDIYHWSTKFKNALQELIRTATARTQAKKVTIGTIMQNAIQHFQTCDKEWKAAKTEYQEVKQKSRQLRRDHIEERAQYNVEQKLTGTMESEIKRLNHIEEQRQQSARLRNALKPYEKTGISSVLIPALSEYTEEERTSHNFDHYSIAVIWKRILPTNGKDVVHWERITDKTVVEDLLLAWQRKHFSQASETPFATIEWNDKLMNKKVQDEILNGTFTANDPEHDIINNVLVYMKRPPSIKDEITTTSTYEEFKQFINGASEKTTTSPSGRGYNHYKSLIEGEGESILRVIHKVLELARKYGIILDRWKVTVTTLIEKEKHKPKIHRMRAIHIIEAEVQFIAKLFYCKKLLCNAEKHNLITEQQYGGRKMKQAQSAVINKLLYYNLSHQQLIQAAYIDDDARNCYDRIIAALSSVELRSWGQSFHEANFSVNFLQQQKYYLRTSFGITKRYYSYSRHDPIHGSGQGIGWAGVKFTRTSDTVSKGLKHMCSGMKFQDPARKITVRKNGDFFVDDTSLGVTLNVAKELTILKQLQHDQQQHAFLLYAQGHKIAWDKCHYYAVDFIRDKLKHRHKLIHEMPGDIFVSEGFGQEKKKIRRMQPFETHRTLGTYISVTMNQKKQLDILTSISDKWRNHLQTKYLNSSDTQYAYKGYLNMAIQYILPTTILTYKECKTVAKKIEDVLLNSYTIQRNCSRTVLYMPKEFGGLGIHHIYHLQGLQRLKFMMMHIRRKDETGNLMLISLRWSQLEFGTKKPFYEQDMDHAHSLITPTWISHNCKYLYECKAYLHLPNEPTAKLYRKNDFYLMDIIHQSSATLRQKIIFNQIRLRLKIMTASDIVTLGTRTSILDNIWNCRNLRKSTLDWPNILPYPVTWTNEWKSILRNYIQPKLNTSPLGKWINEPHQYWKYHVNKARTIITDGTQFFQKIGNQNLYSKTNVTASCNIRADVVLVNDCIRLSGCSAMNIYEENGPDIHFSWIKRNLGTIKLTHDNLESLEQHLLQDNIIGASDGSVNNGIAGHAYCLATKDTQQVLIQGTAPVDCKKTQVTSYRTEASGALATVTLLSYLAKRFKIQQGNIQLHIDNTETVNHINQNLNPTVSSSLRDHIDITTELHYWIKSSPFKITAYHVKAHIEDESQRTQYTILNEQMDACVGEFTTSPPPRWNPRNVAPTLKTQQILLHNLHHQPIIADIENTLIKNFMYNDIVKYFQKHHSIPKEFIGAIDTLSLGQVLSKNSQKLGARIKCLNSQWDTMERSHRWKISPSPKCPLCKQHVETWQHVCRCNQHDMVRTRNEFMGKFEKDLRYHQTLPELQQIILQLVYTWISNKPLQYTCQSSPYQLQLQTLLSHQLQLGQETFIKGLLSNQFRTIQGEYYTREIHDKTFNTTRWSQMLITKLLDFRILMWKTRCEKIHAEKQSTEDTIFRTKAHNLLTHLKSKKDLLHPSDQFLLNKKKAFFFHARRENVDMWYIRLETSVEREAERRKLFPSIIPFMQKGKRKNYTKIVSPPPPEPKKYTQQLLWGNTISSPLTPPQRHKRSKAQVQRSNKKQHTLYRSFAQNKASQTTKRNEHTVNHTSITNISIKRHQSAQHRESLRKELRRTGNDPKNSR